MYHSFIKVDKGYHVPYIYLFGVLYRKACTKQKRLMQTCLDYDRNIINAGVTIWDHVCMLVVETFNTCSDLNVHLYDSPEHFMKLLM